MKRDLLFELPKGDRGQDFLPEVSGQDSASDLPAFMLRGTIETLPRVSQKEVIRHFDRLIGCNFGLDTGPYLLGGHTMRHPPKVGEHISKLEGFQDVHPLQSDETVSAMRRIQEELISSLKDLMGIDELCLEPASYGQAELLALDIICEHFGGRELERKTLLVADNSYFQGDSLAKGLGFKVERIASSPDEGLRLPDLRRRDDVAALFFSIPNCFGRWEKGLESIVSDIHEAGGMVVNHARNAAGFLTYWKPGDSGIDIDIFPLSGLFGVPHYGGGPSLIAVAAKGSSANAFRRIHGRRCSGDLRPFGANWLILLRAYVYLNSLGWEGLRRATEDAVLSANYLQERFKINMAIAGEGRCLNQFAVTIPDFLEESGINAKEMAQRLLDFGIHGPGVGELPILKEYLSFEPTEASTHQVLNDIAESIGQIAIEAARNAPLVKGAPHTTPVAQPKISEALEEMIVVYTPGIIHSHDVGCGCKLCAAKS